MNQLGEALAGELPARRSEPSTSTTRNPAAVAPNQAKVINGLEARRPVRRRA